MIFKTYATFCFAAAAAAVMIVCRGHADKDTETMTKADIRDLIVAQTSLTNALTSVATALTLGLATQRGNLPLLAGYQATEPLLETQATGYTPRALILRTKPAKSTPINAGRRGKESLKIDPTTLRSDSGRLASLKTDPKALRIDPERHVPVQGLLEVLLLEVFFESPWTAPGRQYYLSKKSPRSDIDMAESMCRVLGGFLAEIDDAKENSLVQSYLSKHPSFPKDNGGVYISGNDLQQENTWVHQRASRPVTFFNWRKGQPDNAYKKEHCLEMREGKAGWDMNDRRCDNDSGNMRFLCEVPHKD